AGTGISEAEGKRLEAEFKGILRDTPPFTSFPKLRANESVFFVEPELVAEVKFAEWTKENQLRQASYKGLRTDKNAKEVRLEKTAPIEESIMENGKFEIKGVKISSPDKVIFETENITKLDVIRYYEQVANRMLPYLSHRVLSIVRCPKGISQSCFYKKHPGADNKGIVTIPIISSEGKTEEYFYIENETGLIYEAQMGTIEFHTWGSRVEAIENPDMMVFDLDPDEGMDIEQVRIGVMDIKSILEELSLKSYLKTSGGKGYHVVVPLKPTATWEVINTFARKIAEVMEQKRPDRHTSNVRKAKRAGKIFIDWIRNGRGATSVAPYSLRARKGASVSMPLSWAELNTVAPDEIGMSEALKRINGLDPWHDFFMNNQVIR
ncbi:MAG: DNA ligase D, partial [Clostridiales bacterium]|nr:DNA ligase D [Clostridiales bacterium]